MLHFESSYKKISLASISFLVLVIILSLCSNLPVAKAVGGLQQANGAYYSNPYGTRADIVTANPTIRASGYQFSWVRATVQYEPGGGTNNYVEIGWYKDGASGNISITVVSENFGSHFQQSYTYHPLVGTTHTYQLLWNSSNAGYDARYDGIFIVNRAGPVNLTRVFSGGETGDSTNAIGVSNSINNQYASTSSGGWTNYPSHILDASPGYDATYISANGWTARGQN